MSLRLASLFLASSILPAAALTGCADEPPASAGEPPASAGELPAHFADATFDQLERAYSAAVGFDLSSALRVGLSFAGDNDPTACPARVTTGVDTTVTGGCTAEDGTRFEGSITIHNLGIDALPSAQPSSVEADFHVLSPEGKSSALVGRVELDTAGLRGDLTIDGDGIKSTSHLDLRRGDDGLRVASPGAEIAISDLGIASVEGSWKLSEPPVGRAIVRGADVLDLDITGRVLDFCVPYTAGDKSATVCPRPLSWLFEVPDRAAAQALTDARALRWPW